jgi:hypothetical protein
LPRNETEVLRLVSLLTSADVNELKTPHRIQLHREKLVPLSSGSSTHANCVESRTTRLLKSETEHPIVQKGPWEKYAPNAGYKPREKRRGRSDFIIQAIRKQKTKGLSSPHGVIECSMADQNIPALSSPTVKHGPWAKYSLNRDEATGETARKVRFHHLSNTRCIKNI